MADKLIRNEREAIEAIKSNMPTSGYYMLREALEMAMCDMEEIQRYRSIGTVEECMENADKCKPKKAVKRSYVVPYEGIDVCPVCKQPIGKISKYCKNCGQAIDRSEEVK